MNTWRTTGSILFPDSANPELSRGTSRQPSSACPSSLMARSISYSQRGAKPVPAAGTPCPRRTGPRAEAAPLRGHFLAQEPVRDLNQNAGAVALQWVGADRAAMGQVLEDQQPLVDDGMAPGALDIGDEADAAGVMFVGGVVQALRRRTIEG